MYKPVLVEGDINAILSQQLSTDAIYVKDFMAMEKLSTEKLHKLAVILHEVDNANNLCVHVQE